jgi:hypothetical protein
VLLIIVGLGLFLYRAVNLLRKRSETSWEERDLFWPVLFAGFGVLWLLVNLTSLPFDNIGVLIGLWPVLLVGAGLDLMVGRRWPLIGALLGGLVAASLIWFAFNVDRLQLDTRLPALPSWEEFTGGNSETERVVGSGIMKEESRTVKGFNRIRIEAGGVTEITQNQANDQNSLSVEADENLLPYITSEVHGGELRLSIKPGVSLAPSQSIRFTITVNSLTDLDVSGSSEAKLARLTSDQLTLQASGMGKISGDSLQVNSLLVKSNGAGSVSVAGQTDGLEVEMSGSSRLRAENLQSQVAKVQISGAGEALIWVIRSLEARLSGSASLNYYGAPPTITQNTSGSASVQGLGTK